jgi:hypothetical protein
MKQMKLTLRERKARAILIRVAQGHLVASKLGYISYKELWSRISRDPWGQSRTNDVVDSIVRISGFELAEGRPPLNEIVVRTNKTLPTYSWARIRQSLIDKFDVNVPYLSHREAQEACWNYWSCHDANKLAGKAKKEDAAEEGVKQDRTVTFRSRNSKLIAKRKKLDQYKCKACGFKLIIDGKYVIDCHHTNPLGMRDAVTVTHILDLVCLCPTCHRVAHTRRYPLSVVEIKAIRGLPA